MVSGSGAFQAQSTSEKCALARGTKAYPASSSTIATTAPRNAMDSFPRSMFGCNVWMTVMIMPLFLVKSAVNPVFCLPSIRFQYSKEVLKSKFRQYRQMETQRWEESEKTK